MGSKKNAQKKKSTNRFTKKRRQIQKLLRKKYRGGEGEPEPEVKPSGFMSRIKDFWNWMTGKKDVPSPTNGEIPEAPVEEPIENPVEGPIEGPIEESVEESVEEPKLKTSEEELEEEPNLKTSEEESVEEPKLKTSEEESVEEPIKPPMKEPDEKASPFENPTEETNESPFKKIGGRKKKTKRNRSTKKRRKH